MIMIAHRLTAVTACDRILLVKNGKIAECGSPEQLLAQNGAYAHMRELQTQAQNWAIAR